MADVKRTLGKWLLYVLLGALALVAFKESDISRKQKEQAVRYAECVKENKIPQEECAKQVRR